jgi:hypothetical protein
MKLAALVLLALAGCASTPTPACPDLPELASTSTLSDLEAHHLAVVRLYGACRAMRADPPKSGGRQ